QRELDHGNGRRQRDGDRDRQLHRRGEYGDRGADRNADGRRTYGDGDAERRAVQLHVVVDLPKSGRGGWAGQHDRDDDERVRVERSEERRVGKGNGRRQWGGDRDGQVHRRGECGDRGADRNAYGG